MLPKTQIFVKIKAVMKLFLTILLIVGIAGGATVSFLTMNNHGGCVASQAAGMVCPQLNALAYIGIHADFLKSFSEAFLVILAIFSGLAVLVFFRFSDDNFYFDKNFFVRELKKTSVTNKNKYKQICWLSLFENSPAIS